MIFYYKPLASSAEARALDSLIIEGYVKHKYTFESMQPPSVTVFGFVREILPDVGIIFPDSDPFNGDAAVLDISGPLPMRIVAIPRGDTSRMFTLDVRSARDWRGVPGCVIDAEREPYCLISDADGSVFYYFVD